MGLPKKVIFLACGFCVIFAISFGPILITAWWHLLHGDHIQCAGRSFHVPFRWHAKVEGNKAYISKFRLTVFAGSPTSALISLWPVADPPTNEAEKNSTYQSFTSVYWTYLSDGAGDTRGPIRRGTGENEAVCMQTSVIKGRWASVSCLVHGGTWYGTFYGQPEEIQSFYKIIQ